MWIAINSRFTLDKVVFCERAKQIILLKFKFVLILPCLSEWKSIIHWSEIMDAEQGNKSRQKKNFKILFEI